MATAADISWGNYRTFEGPFYRGKHPFVLPANATRLDKMMYVVTSTEGGRWDAYNGYDRCICTSGLIQWCEAGQYSVSALLGDVAVSAPEVLDPFHQFLASKNVAFRQNEKGQYRFFFQDGRGEVNTLQKQQQLFLLRSSGQAGSWDAASRRHAKEFAAAVSSVWENPKAQQIQSVFTASRLLTHFTLETSKMVLQLVPDTDIGRAFEAMYISYAANNPLWADKSLREGLKTNHAPWTKDWLIAVLQEMIFFSGITIWPHRYDAIRPVLEKVYNLDLPDFASEIKKWKDDEGGALWSTEEVQQALIDVGYDLGLFGADGKWGNKSREAMEVFQEQFSVDHPIRGYPDVNSRRALLKAQERFKTANACLP